MRVKSFFKPILACVLLLLAVTFVASCDNGSNKIEEVRLVASSVPNSMLIDEVESKLETIQIKVVKKDGKSEIINVTTSMISAEDLAKLDEAGTYSITINYEGFQVKINVVITAPVAPVEGDEVTYTDAIILANLKTLDALPEAYDLYVWVWGSGVEGVFVPAADGKFTAPTGCDSAVFLLMPVGLQPAWADIYDQTNDLAIINGAVGVPTAGETLTFTITPAEIEATLKDGATMPTVDYDLYVYTWGGKVNGFSKVGDNLEFAIDAGTAGLTFVLMPKGEPAGWDSKLAQTSDYIVCWNAAAKAFLFCGSKVTSTLETVTSALEAEVTEEYDLYAWVWGGTPENLFTPVTIKEDGSIEFVVPKDSTECLFVFMKKGTQASWGSDKIAQTGNYVIAEGAITPKPAE